MAQGSKRRRLDPAAPLGEQFQALRQIPNLDLQDCRAIVALLNQDHKKTGAHVAKKRWIAYPNACVALGDPLLIDSSRFPCLSVAKVVQHKVNSCEFFKECLLEALRDNNNELDMVVFWDEAVPGNVLAPDLRRKAGLTY